MKFRYKQNALTSIGCEVTLNDMPLAVQEIRIQAEVGQLPSVWFKCQILDIDFSIDTKEDE